MPGLLIVNPRSGRAGPSADELRDEARRLGVDTHVLGVPLSGRRAWPGVRLN